MRPRFLTRMFVAAAVGVAVMTPGFAPAQVVHNNGAPDNTSGFNITINQWTTANDFTIGSSKQGQTVLTSFDFWVLQQNQAASVTSSFFWRILSDDGGLPGSTVVGEGNVTNATGVLSPYYCCGTTPFLYSYLFSASLGNLNIGSGVFWLAIGGYTTESDNGVWYWATSAQTGNQAQSFQNGPWENVASEGAFVLYGSTSMSTVPEPGTLLLTGSSLAGLAGYWSRRRRRSNAP